MRNGPNLFTSQQATKSAKTQKTTKRKNTPNETLITRFLRIMRGDVDIYIYGQKIDRKSGGVEEGMITLFSLAWALHLLWLPI